MARGFVTRLVGSYNWADERKPRVLVAVLMRSETKIIILAWGIGGDLIPVSHFNGNPCRSLPKRASAVPEQVVPGKAKRGLKRSYFCLEMDRDRDWIIGGDW